MDRRDPSRTFWFRQNTVRDIIIRVIQVLRDFCGLFAGRSFIARQSAITLTHLTNLVLEKRGLHPDCAECRVFPHRCRLHEGQNQRRARFRRRPIFPVAIERPDSPDSAIEDNGPGD